VVVKRGAVMAASAPYREDETSALSSAKKHSVSTLISAFLQNSFSSYLYLSLIPISSSLLDLSSHLSIIAQVKRLKSTGAMQQPCLKPLFTKISSDIFPLRKDFTMLNNFSGTLSLLSTFRSYQKMSSSFGLTVSNRKTKQMVTVRLAEEDREPIDGWR